MHFFMQGAAVRLQVSLLELELWLHSPKRKSASLQPNQWSYHIPKFRTVGN
jgi:hypothetical protein